MKVKRTLKKSLSFLCSILILATSILSSLQTAFAAPASDLPEEMINSYILEALEYTGYKVQAQKDNGTLFQSGQYGPYAGAKAYLSGIGYSYVSTGTETTADM